jgi:chemotaxis signal transduction protein
MTTDTASSSKSLVEMRWEFDNAFAIRPAGAAQERESLIMLRVGGESLAVRTLHITGVAKRSRILPIPTPVPCLLGIAAIHNTLLPVYDLAALLGLHSGAAEGAWFMLTCPQTPIALLFDAFEGQVDTEPSGLYGSEGPAEHVHLRSMARIGAAHRAVIDIPGIVEQIGKDAGLLAR